MKDQSYPAASKAQIETISYKWTTDCCFFHIFVRDIKESYPIYEETSLLFQELFSKLLIIYFQEEKSIIEFYRQFIPNFALKIELITVLNGACRIYFGA